MKCDFIITSDLLAEIAFIFDKSKILSFDNGTASSAAEQTQSSQQTHSSHHSFPKEYYFSQHAGYWLDTNTDNTSLKPTYLLLSKPAYLSPSRNRQDIYKSKLQASSSANYYILISQITCKVSFHSISFVLAAAFCQ